MSKIQLKEIERAIVLGIKDYFKKNNVKKAVIGISGGLDSAVSCFLVLKALGKANVIGIMMPDTVTSKESLADAKKVIRKLGIKHYLVPIDTVTTQFSEINAKNKLKKNLAALANAKARTRMTILYYFAQQHNAFVIGTSDKSEIALGYTTKFGDNASDIMVIGDLWKTDAMKLGKHLGVPKSILTKKPSAELIKDQTAESELGAPYSTLDKILRLYIEKDLSASEIIKKGFSKKIVDMVVRRVRQNEHKRRSPMIVRVSERSFHNSEWRMPVTNRY